MTDDLRKILINYILEGKYWCKSAGVRRGRQRTKIADNWIEYRKKNNIHATAEDFIEIWEFLDKTK